MILTIDDSDRSVNSSITVNDGAPTKQPIASIALKPQSPSRKVVCFNECRNEYYPNADRVAEECHETWYTAAEYDQIIHRLRQVVSNEMNKANGESDDEKKFGFQDS